MSVYFNMFICLKEEDINSDDELSEDGQTRQKAERRRAKKKVSGSTVCRRNIAHSRRVD